MKYIISTIGAAIKFNLSGTRKLVIDTVVPLEVSDPEFSVLKTRLGNQIRSVSPVAATVVEEEKAPVNAEASAGSTVTDPAGDDDGVA